MKKFEPRQGQEIMINTGLDIVSPAFFAEVGCGKTVCALTILQEHLKLKRINKALIIAPNRVAQGTWQNELMKWDHLGLLRKQGIQLISGTEKQRIKIINDKAHKIFVISYDLVAWLMHWYAKGAWPFNIIDADESSKLRNRASKRFKACTDILDRVDSWTNLTGLPAPNGIQGLWSQIYLQDQGERLFNSYKQFTDRWFHVASDGFGTLYPKAKATAEILKKVSDICISLKTRDYVDFPVFRHVNIDVELPGKIRKFYDKLERELYAELQNVTVDCFNSGVLTSKLRQIANGCIYYDPGSREYEVLHQEKLTALEDLIDELYGEPVLIAYHYQSDAKEIIKKFPKFEISTKAKDIENRFNAGKIPGLLMPAGSDAYGLNLQYGGHIIIWYGGTFDLEAWVQFNGRQERPGQTKEGFIYRINAVNTIDQVMAERIESKKPVTELLMNYLKARCK